jgi:hypothetical protein
MLRLHFSIRPIYVFFEEEKKQTKNKTNIVTRCQIPRKYNWDFFGKDQLNITGYPILIKEKEHPINFTINLLNFEDIDVSIYY